MGKHKATVRPTQASTQAEAAPQRGMTTGDKAKVLRTRMQLARLLLSKDVPDILLPDVEKLLLAGNTTLLRRAERATESRIEIEDIVGEDVEGTVMTDEAEQIEDEPAPPSGPRRGVRR